jgi:uncharacterized delta-60 repeat protein
VNGTVYSLAVQADGKILLGGSFSTVNGASYNRIARLNADGTPDTNFNGNASSTLWSTVVQADGKILIGYSFSGMARLNADGTADGSFNADVTGQILGIAVQADGKILIGGNFTSVGGAPHYRIARLNTDGTVDDSFNPNASSSVNSIVIQPDGKILMAGNFTTVNGATYNLMARLNADGTVDTSFINPGGNISIVSMALQADGKILIVGGFTTLGGAASARIARLNADGTVDSSFNQNLQGGPSGIAIQADGQILIGGPFSSVGGDSNYAHLARLYNSVATQILSVPDVTQVKWSRSGAAPEVSAVTFESSTDGGVTWSALGNATRITGGWQLTGLSLPSTGYVRARGRASGGYDNGSSSLIEQTAPYSASPPPVFITVTTTGGKLILAWPSGTLQAATAVTGLYTNVPNAVSPFTNTMALPRSFFRVKVQ